MTIDINADDGESGEGDLVATDVERIFGGSGNDTLTGGDGDGEIWGGQGNDTVRGRAILCTSPM